MSYIATAELVPLIFLTFRSVLVQLATKRGDNLHKLLDTIVTENDTKGLILNIEKTETMVISRKKNSPKCNVKMKEQLLGKLMHKNICAHE